MLTVVDLLNRVTGAVVGVILAPFNSSPAWGMAAISLVAGAGLLFVYKLTSSQEGIRRTKDKIWGRFYELRLFQHDIRLLLSAQASLVRANFRYLSHSLIPLLFMVPPVVFLLSQLNLRYGLRPLRPGETALLTVTVADAIPLDDASAESGQESCVRVATEAVRVPSLNEAVWRLQAVRDGHCTVTIRMGEGAVTTKNVVVGRGAVAVSPRRLGTPWWELVLTPGEPPLEDDRLTAVEISYPERDFRLAGIAMPWWLASACCSASTGPVAPSRTSSTARSPTWKTSWPRRRSRTCG